jgi:hypothetical protein
MVPFVLEIYYRLNKCPYLFPQRDKSKDNQVEFVIARYNEDISWLKMFDGFKITVYNKGDYISKHQLLEMIYQNSMDENIDNIHLYHKYNVYNLNNVGREGHTYLHHILHNYHHYNHEHNYEHNYEHNNNYDFTHNNNYNKVTIFLPASAMSSNQKKRQLRNVLHHVFQSYSSVFYGKPTNVSKSFTMNEYKSSTYANRQKNPESVLAKSAIRPFGKWYSHFVGDEHPNRVFCINGIFAVSSKDIVQHPFSYYEKIWTDVSFHSNPEAGHFLERSWCGIFYPHPSTCEYFTMF